MVPDITATAARAAGATKPASVSSKAYMTFLVENGDYVKGVVGLAKGLRKAKSKYPLVVAVLLDVPEEHLQILVWTRLYSQRNRTDSPTGEPDRFAMAYYISIGDGENFCQFG